MEIARIRKPGSPLSGSVPPCGEDPTRQYSPADSGRRSVAADAFNPCPLSFSLPLQRSGGGGQNTRAVVGHGPEQWRLVGGRLLRDRTKSHFLFCTPSSKYSRAPFTCGKGRDVAVLVLVLGYYQYQYQYQHALIEI